MQHPTMSLILTTPASSWQVGKLARAHLVAAEPQRGNGGCWGDRAVAAVLIPTHVVPLPQGEVEWL